MLRINFPSDHENVYRPGERIQAQLSWDLATVPQKVVAQLVWNTEGKGDEDSEVVVEQEWVANTHQGAVPLNWIAPRGPLSLSGHLIRVRWNLEAFCENSKIEEDEASMSIVLSETGEPIALKPIK